MRKLSARLLTIAGFIDIDAAVADIGTDHGYLPVYLALNNPSRRIIASDISERALGAARRSAAKYGVTGSVTFIVAPGLAGIGTDEADTVVIAGMGAETIIGILSEAPWTRNIGVSLVLQPQTKITLLLSWLQENGYAVCETKQAWDSGRLYTIIHAQGAVQ
ncbi:MAG: class I SAM-dependent methyltransferase [Oscillospiraceae bacterium]|nr:class I SAM-dependent methyltransferase [Oscillospiraceae bacterium]